MSWEERIGSIHYIGVGLNTDIYSPPSVGDEVRLRSGDDEFLVEIIFQSKNSFKGRVVKVGPAPALAANGMRREDIVDFDFSHIFALRRRVGEG